MKPKIIYWLTIPSPYMVDRFNALARRGNLDFEVWFNARTRPFRKWEVDESKWHFRYCYLPGFRFLGHDWGWPPLPMLSRKPDVLFMLYAEPIFMLGWLLAWIRGIRIVFFVEKTPRSWNPERWWKEILKRIMFRRAAGIAHIGEDTKKYVNRYARPGQSLICLPHVVDVEHFARSLSVTPERREEIRNNSGLRGVTFLYVGRFLPLKRLGLFLRAFAVLQKDLLEDVSVLMVGEGEYEERLKRLVQEKNIRNVVFAGHVQKDLLPEYYAAADVFVKPTSGDVYAMVIDEAMAAGLPVICTSAVGEIAGRVRDGVSGFVVPPDDQQALFARMKDLALSAELRRSMAEEGRKWVSGRTPDWWAGLFEASVETLLRSDRAGGS